MPIGGTCTERTIQATDFSDHRFWRKSSELCFRLGGEILRVLYDVINDFTNDVIFYLKKLILKPFLHIKGSKYESSRYDIYERASSGLSKNRSRFPNRPSWAELRRAQSCRFSSFSTQIGGTHYGRTMIVGDLPNHKCVYLDWNCALGWVKKNSDNPGRQKWRH